MKVWVVILDEGSSQEAEESIDSVWLMKAGAERRSETLNSDMQAQRYLGRWPARIEAHKVQVRS